MLVQPLTSLVRLSGGACLWLVALAAHAQTDKPFAAPGTTEHAAVPGAASLGQVTLSLLLVLGAVFAAAWLVRRLRGLGKFGSPAIQVIADVGLGPKERAVLVQVGHQQLLLGVAPGRISTLHVLGEPVLAANAAKTATPTDSLPGATLPPDFKAILKRSLGLK